MKFLYKKDESVETTCPDCGSDATVSNSGLKTGGLKWNYMNSILRSWNEKNLHTPQEILQGDSAPAHPQVSQLPQRRENAAFRRHGDALSDLERQAVERALAEGKEG